MATVKGLAEVRQFIAQLPARLEQNVLRGAARAAAVVIANQAKENTQSGEVRDSIRVSSDAKDGRIVGKVQTKGPGAYLAPWEEYGTAPHFISVDDSQRRGMGVGRINRKVSEGSLVIGGTFVGTTVHHPGARPHPFLRPALDLKEADAIAAAQAYINARIAKADLTSAPPADEE